MVGLERVKNKWGKNLVHEFHKLEEFYVNEQINADFNICVIPVIRGQKRF